jgi:glycosyltransferase involved in cell wall biosynthesis
VVVPTFRRVERLEHLLPALVDQAATIGARVIVIDNDPDAGARATVTGWADVGVRYAHEPRPGISAARNRGIDESALADALVYIDDDEMPAPGWLELSSQRGSATAATRSPAPCRRYTRAPSTPGSSPPACSTSRHGRAGRG